MVYGVKDSYLTVLGAMLKRKGQLSPASGLSSTASHTYQREAERPGQPLTRRVETALVKSHLDSASAVFLPLMLLYTPQLPYG